MAEANKPQQTGGYGKRPVWQWVLIYLIVGGIVYFLIYWLLFRDSGGSSLYNY